MLLSLTITLTTQKEIECTLKAAKGLDFNRVWAVFQPFTYSRTKILMNDFVKALSIADIAVITDIMGSREKKYRRCLC